MNKRAENTIANQQTVWIQKETFKWQKCVKSVAKNPWWASISAMPTTRPKNAGIQTFRRSELSKTARPEESEFVPAASSPAGLSNLREQEKMI